MMKKTQLSNIPRLALRFLSPLLLVAALLATAFFLLTYESEYLWKIQELNLFLDTPLYLRQQMVTSGWLLTWAGSWFTEFFYHPWMGVGMFCAWLALMMLVVGRAFRIPIRWAVVLLIPVAAIVMANVQLGYWIYYLKLRGVFFTAAIGITVAAGSVWLYRSLPVSILWRCAYMTLSTAVLYPLAGFYGLLATLLMGVLTWRIDCPLQTPPTGGGCKRAGVVTSLKVAATVTALLNIVLWPLLYYHYVFCQTSMDNIWWTALPIFVFDKEYATYYTPYYILAASLLLLAALYGWWQRQEKWPTAVLVSQVAIAGCCVWGTYHFWYKDYNFHKELRMQQCVENLNWKGVEREGAEQRDEPTRAIVMMRNLALFRLGVQGDRMYHYKMGAKASDTPLPIAMTQVVGRLVYYNYGQTNFCYRWCLEDGVEMGWRVEYLKYLVRCSLANGEERVARKYINMLKHTRYHRQWAEHYEQFIGKRETLAANPEFKQILHLMTGRDVLASDQSLTEKFLIYQFIDNQSPDPLYQEQALLSALWTKDIQIFWPRFFTYAAIHKDNHMPVHFQEAAYLYGHLEQEVDISRMPFDKEVAQAYNDFMAMAQQYRGLTEEQMKPIFYPRFGHTFYYDYFLIRNQKLY